MPTILHFNRHPDEDERVAPQESIILGIVESLGSCERKQLVDELAKLIEKGEFITKQKPETLIAFYQRKLADRKFIVVEKLNAKDMAQEDDEGKSDETAAA